MKKVKIIVLDLAIAALLCVACLSGYRLVKAKLGYREAEKTYEKAAGEFVTPQPRETLPAKPERPDLPAPESKEYAPIQVDFAALKAQSDNAVGWIYCPDTCINYPVAQGPDNYYYLHRMVNGDYNLAGTIFLDTGADRNFEGFHHILHGHHMHDGSMFAPVESYRDPEFFRAHPVMYLLTPEKDYRMNILGGVLTDGSSDLYRFPEDEESYRAYLEEFFAQMDEPLALGDRLPEKTLALSTCSYDLEDGRYILLGVLTELDRREASTVE